MKYGLPEDTVNQINRVLARFPEVTRAVLYGSRAKGNHKPGSDIDLSVLALLNHPELEAHIRRVGLVFYEKNANGPTQQTDF